MLWLTLAMIGLIPVLTRIWGVYDRTGDTPKVWWWANSISLMAMVAGSAFLIAEPTVNAALGVPNISYLLSNLSFVVAAGAVQIFCHCLRTERPSPQRMMLHAATAAGVAAVITFGWVIAPVHDVVYEHFRQAPITRESLLYDVVFHVYLGLVVLNVAVCAYTEVGKTDADPGRRLGGLVISAGTAIDVVAHALYLLRIGLQPAIGAPALTIAAAADGLTVLCVLGVASGMALFQIAPRVRHQVRTFQLASQLRPAWARVRELYPSVALPGERVAARRGIKAERMLIEISDAMRNLPVRRTLDETDPAVAVAAALAKPPTNPDCTASDLLPTPTTRHDEEGAALAIARSYARLEPHAS